MSNPINEIESLSTSSASSAKILRQRSAPYQRILFNHRHWVMILMALAAFASIGLGLTFGTGRADDENESEPIRRLPVNVVRAELVSSIEQLRTYTGDIRARQQSELGFEFSGRIAAILVDEGDHVESQQELAILDTRTLQARKDAMHASLNQAKARLKELEVGPRKETIAASEARLREAKSVLKLADLNFQRRRKLNESNAISTEEFQRATYARQSAQAVVDSAQKTLDELLAGTRDEQISAQEAAVAQLEASLKEIEVQIEKSSIIAPFAGRIVKRMADPGGLGMPSQPILHLVETEYLEAVVGLPVDVAASLSPDDSIFVSVEGENYAGKILAKIQQIETATRTRKVLIQLDDSANARVLPGQLCQVEIPSTLETSGYWVPTTALTNGIRGLWSLMAVDDEDRVSRQDVEVIYTDGDRALVRGTLSGEEWIICEGTHRLVDGQPIDILNRSETATK